MANKYWVNGDADGLWNKSNNWGSASGTVDNDGVPGAADTVIFDDQVVDNCTADANISVAAFVYGAGDYTGTFDADTFDVAVAGNFDTSRAETTVRFGSGAWTIGGNLDLDDATTYGEGTDVTMTGASKLLFFGFLQDAGFKLIVAVGASITASDRGSERVAGLDITGSLDIDGIVPCAGNVDLQAGGSLTGTWLRLTSGYTVTTFGAAATLNINELEFYRHSASTVNLAQGKYDCDLTLGTDNTQAVVFRFAAGTTEITGDLSVEERNTDATATVDTGTNNASLDLGGDVKYVNGLAWSKGTGGIDLNGTGVQSINFNGESVEDITVSNTGGIVTFASSFTCDSFTQDANADVDGAVTITITGALDINGTAGNECIWNGPDVDCGSGDADYCTVTDSDASAGAEIDATNNCTEVGVNNVNWDFGGAPPAVATFGNLLLLGVGGG